MNKLSLDLFNHITYNLDVIGAPAEQSIVLSKEGFEELKKWASDSDEKQDIQNNIVYVNHVLKNNSFRTIKYSDEELIEEVKKFQIKSPKILPLLIQDEPMFHFWGYIFKLKIQ